MNLLSEIYLSYTPVHIESLIGEKGRNQRNKNMPVDQLKEYAVEDADITLQLKNLFEPRIRKEGLYKLHRKLKCH